MTTNYEWFIQTNLDKYAGKWVAIDNKKVLDSDLKLDILLKKIKDKHPKLKQFITKINPKIRVASEIIRVSDISDTFGKLQRKVTGQEFKDMARSGW